MKDGMERINQLLDEYDFSVKRNANSPHTLRRLVHWRWQAN